MVMTMLRLALLVVVMVCITQPAQAASLLSVFGRSLGPQEEASYTMVHKTDGFEERLYPAKKWVCTEQKGSYSSGDQIDVFLRLFSYIDGENSREEKLPMGIPVSVEHRTVGEQEVYNACFFIPEAAQENPPKPSDPRVVIILRPKTTVLSREFGGFANDEETWNKEAAEFASLLTEAGVSFVPSLVFWNAYDSPLKFWGRRNEVWLVRE